MSRLKRGLILLAVLAGAATGYGVPVLAADADALKQVIQESDILYPEYRTLVNVVAAHAAAAVSVFRHPDATDTDCKIDAVLMGKRLFDADSNLRTLQVRFYDFSQEDRFTQVDVPRSLVSSYASGAIDQTRLLKSLTATRQQGNPLTTLYASANYKTILEGLCLVDGPLKEERAAIKIKLDAMSAAGADISDVQSRYLHSEDLARRGMSQQLRVELDQLKRVLDGRERSTDRRRAHLNAIVSVGKPM